MAANEFEKNVRGVMDEFKIHPSDEVWPRVEQRIRKEKRKRKIIFFFLFACIGLALGGYGIYNYSGRQNVEAQIGTAKNDQMIQGTRDKVQGTRDKVQGTSDKGQSNNAEDIKDKGRANATNKTNISSVAIVSNRNPSGDKKVVHKNIHNKRVSQAVAGMNRKITSPRTNEEQEENDKTNITDRMDRKDISVDKNKSVVADTSGQKLTFQPTEKNVTVNFAADTTALTKQEKKKDEEIVPGQKSKSRDQNFRKLKWVISFSAGSSTITQDRFSFKGTLYANSASYSTPGTPTGGGPGVFYSPSPNRSAFAFKTGVSLAKDISPRSSLSVGLAYSDLGDRIRIGSKQGSGLQSTNSSSPVYYSGAPQNTYADHFHFIELPVIYEWRINKNTNRYFSLSGRASTTYLLSTNALVYDTTLSGIYYHNKSLFTRTHFNFLSGISCHFRSGKGFELNLGPKFSFDVTRLIKSNLDERKYFLYSGVEARIFFERKKR